MITLETIFEYEVTIDDDYVDRFGRLRASKLLFLAQEAAGRHSALLGTDRDSLEDRNLFWAVTRTRVQITRLPRTGEQVRLQTWPMPATRVAFPRSVIALDSGGRELFRCISLWVLMDRTSRAMVLPGKSGIRVEGLTRGDELAAPGSLMPRDLDSSAARIVRFTDLDVNGHMNNARYFDWIYDLLPAAFHEAHPIREFTIVYASEALEGQELTLSWQILEDGAMQVEGTRTDDGGSHRVFAAKLQFDAEFC